MNTLGDTIRDIKTTYLCCLLSCNLGCKVAGAVSVGLGKWRDTETRSAVPPFLPRDASGFDAFIGCMLTLPH